MFKLTESDELRRVHSEDEVTQYDRELNFVSHNCFPLLHIVPSILLHVLPEKTTVMKDILIIQEVTLTTHRELLD